MEHQLKGRGVETMIRQKGFSSRKKPLIRNAHKLFTCLLILTFIFSSTPAFAQMPVAVSGVLPSPGELSKIGVVAAAKGMVEVTTPGAAGRVVQSGEEIFIGDEVKTDAMGHLQILLLDETVFTIGPNSAITIDKFIYDPKTQVGNMQASITKGVFRYISGKIAAKKPENVTIKLPTATIGIRGTIVAGEASPTRSMAMLLGPGSRNETGATIGSFVMTGTGENAGQREHVTRSGFGVSVDQAGSLSGVFQVPETQLQHLTTALLPGQGQGPGLPGKENNPDAARGQGPPGPRPPAGSMSGPMPGMPAPGSGPLPLGPVPIAGKLEGGVPAPGSMMAPMMASNLFGAGENMGKLSGEQTFLGFATIKQINMIEMLQGNLDQDSTLASQDALRNSAVQVTSRTERATLKDDLLRRPDGLFHYERFNGNFIFKSSGTDYQGTFNASIDVDFAMDKLGGAHPTDYKNSYVSINVPVAAGLSSAVTDHCVLDPKLFSGLVNPHNTTDPNPPAVFKWTNLPGTTTGAGTGTFNVTVEVQDIVKQLTDGTTTAEVANLAVQAKVTVDYSTTSTPNPGTGSGEMIAPIQPLATNTAP
jgi:hypothetical protein